RRNTISRPDTARRRFVPLGSYRNPKSTLGSPPSTDYAQRLASHDAAFDRVQRLHDVRLVRPPAEPERSEVVRCRARELGDRALRVSAASAGESHRLHGADAAAAQDSAGSDHALGLRALRDLLHAAAAAAGFS